MRTYLDCVPCFFKQALEAGKIAGASKAKQKIILDKLAKDFPKFSLSSSPPELGRTIYGIVTEVTGERDPFAKIKAKSNRLALKIYKKLKNKVAHSSDRLLMAAELAIAGNIIDYGVKNSLNVNTELVKILAKEHRSITQESKVTFDYKSFKHALKRSGTILYLGDNAGETVFDRVLIEEIKSIDKAKDVTYVVKKNPVINDALMEDAIVCGIDKLAKIVSSGSDAPGTVLSLCSKGFLGLYNKADMVISKGQGNFEALSGSKRPVFFLFMAKCPVVAQHVGCKVGDIILSYHPGKRKV